MKPWKKIRMKKYFHQKTNLKIRKSEIMKELKLGRKFNG